MSQDTIQSQGVYLKSEILRITHEPCFCEHCLPDKEMTQGTEKILQNPHFLLDCEINSRRNQYNKEGMELEVAETSEKMFFSFFFFIIIIKK
jgi:hypothetical protein